jgi:hypothetical protein
MHPQESFRPAKETARRTTPDSAVPDGLQSKSVAIRRDPAHLTAGERVVIYRDARGIAVIGAS